MSERVNFAKPHLHQAFVVEVLTAALGRLHIQTGHDPYVRVFDPVKMPMGSDRFDVDVNLTVNGVELPVADVLNAVWEGVDELVEQRAQALTKLRMEAATEQMEEVVEGLLSSLKTIAHHAEQK